MGGIAKLLEGLVDILGVHLDPWVAPAALVGCVALFWPWIRVNLRTDDARKLLKRASRERGAEREKLEREALEMVAGRPDGLVVVAKEALEQGRKALAADAVAQLRATGKLLPQLRILERQLEPPLPILPSEACLLIERLLDTGMFEEARARTAQARRKWPSDEELEAMERRVAERAAAASAQA